MVRDDLFPMVRDGQNKMKWGSWNSGGRGGGGDPNPLIKTRPPKPELLDNAASPNRFRPHDDLFFSLQMLAKNAYGLGNVFVISSGETPHWKDSFPHVQWINENEFMPSEALLLGYDGELHYNSDCCLFGAVGCRQKTTN